MYAVLGALDPNWFYSTMAQSTAALVGLTGGFLVSRLLDRQRDIETARPVVAQQYGIVRDSFGRRRSHAKGVVESLIRVSEHVADLERKGETKFGPGERRDLMLMSGDERYWRSASAEIGKGSAEDVAALRELVELSRDFLATFEAWDDEALMRALRERRAIEVPHGAEWLAEEPDSSVQNEDPRSFWVTVRYEAERSWMQYAWRSEVEQFESVRTSAPASLARIWKRGRAH